ncbi:MAG: hypothetical protein GIW99_01585 [Candidatus Eremiobacteraeota bacterium]|nr:hypothetical protein [Candidatus Eremiobacteraeota bacterium]MBC5826374.1 hypothetical protein [Candidatus Eremiobacteraeota bacterium]
MPTSPRLPLRRNRAKCRTRHVASNISPASRWTVLDVGGGWTPDALDAAFQRELSEFVDLATQSLTSLDQVIIEPGQSNRQGRGGRRGSRLGWRDRRGQREAIVDTGYPELPQARSFAHRVFALHGSTCARLPGGMDRIGGSTCLEYDIVADGVSLPGHMKAGDVVVVCDAGAHDASMAFEFGRGERSLG